MRAAALTIACALLAACAQLPPQPPGAVTTPEPLARDFGLTGRLSVRFEDKGFSGGVRWSHREARDELAFTSPLGQMVAQLTSDADSARLLTSDQKLYRAPSAEQLVRMALGWELPLAGMRYWVLGTPAPAPQARAAERDAEDRLVGFVQNGWQVRILSYLPPQQGGWPANMRMSYGDVEIRLVVDDMQVE